jgi:hypothetical protein
MRFLLGFRLPACPFRGVLVGKLFSSYLKRTPWTHLLDLWLFGCTLEHREIKCGLGSRDEDDQLNLILVHDGHVLVEEIFQFYSREYL